MTRTSPRAATALRNLSSTALLAGVLLAAPAAAFAEAATPPAAAGKPSADVEGLRKEVAELRQMLLQSKQTEQQHRELLQKLQNAMARTGGAGSAAAPGLRPPVAAAPPVVITGRVTGTVHLSGISANQPVYAFVEDLRAPPVRGHTTDITQREKQFWPQVIAVQQGTMAFFPNFDRATHNVFSPGPTAVFDLGQMPGGERGKPIVLSQPGIIKLYCDLHPGMWAEVLVTPSAHFTRVSGGGFRLVDVPVGDHVVAVWTAGAEPTRQTVTVTPQGANLEFVLNVPLRKLTHPNKAGQTYSSSAP
jgi:plastocyanin